MVFSSVYEMFAPLTTVRKQHFWDYFSGATLNSRWTFKAGAGGTVSSQGMTEYGYKLLMTNGHVGTYDFAQKRQFDPDNSVVIGSCKRYNSSGAIGVGFVGDDTDTGSGYYERRATWIRIKTGTNNITGRTADGSGSTDHDTGITSDDSFHTLKCQLTSSATHFSVDGVLKVSSNGSQNETDEKLQPMFISEPSGASSGGYVNYMECYNT